MLASFGTADHGTGLRTEKESPYLSPGWGLPSTLANVGPLGLTSLVLPTFRPDDGSAMEGESNHPFTCFTYIPLLSSLPCPRMASRGQGHLRTEARREGEEEEVAILLAAKGECGPALALCLSLPQSSPFPQ